MLPLPRWLAVLLSTLALGGAVTACGSSDTGSSGGTGGDSQRDDRAGEGENEQQSPTPAP